MPDGVQLPLQLSLPALWARGYGVVSRDPPDEQRRRLDLDVIDAKADIRIVLDALAEKHGVPVAEVHRAMDHVDDALADLVYEIRSELESEAERLSPLD